MALEAPDILEIEQVCDFAETRLEQISEAVTNGDEDPLGDWEANCLTRVRTWLQKLKHLTDRDRVHLAARSLDEVNYGVETMLVISTAHVTEETAAWLDALVHATERPFAIFPKADYGWMIWVGSTYADGEVQSLPDELDNLMKHCTELGIGWLCLDRDGVQHPDFSTFDW